MRILFIDNFNIKWNGYTARHENGISGSHSALMYLAEGLAINTNFNVEIISTTNNIIERNYLNVQYSNLENLEKIVCDYIFITHDCGSLIVLDKIEYFYKIIILTQNDLVNYDRLLSIDKDKIIIGYISEFAKTNILNVQPFLNEYNNILIYNSIDLVDIPSLNNTKENSLCYFACIDRGYKMVVEILKNLDNYILYTNTYDNNYKNLFQSDNDKIKISENSSKYKILNDVSKSKYFIYPLINLDNNQIHYDTFAYVVLEALLCGTIVITPKIKVYEELYGDAICYIDTADIINEDDLKFWKKRNHFFGYPILDRYLEKIKWLDENEDIRNSFIQKGLLLKEKFSNIKISKEISTYISNDRFENLNNHLTKLSKENHLPKAHFDYLLNLKNNGFEPKVIYDIGSCVLHWTNEAKKIWPNAKYILFDAFSEVEFLYKEYEYYLGVLSDDDNKIVKFYQNEYYPGGNSYYREIGCENGKYFPENKYIEKMTKKLDTIITEQGYPLPDLVKIDCQGSEIDIIKGGINTLKNAKRMIIELQHTEYNLNAMKNDESLPLIEKILDIKCCNPLFCSNGGDGDYGFINEKKLRKTIFTIFAGRENNLKILCKYLQKALDLKIIDEVHIWNIARNINDENYIKTISNLKRTSSVNAGNYVQIKPLIKNNSFELFIKASNDIHVKINNIETEYVIVLGGWSNRKSVIRENNIEIFSLLEYNMTDSNKQNLFKFEIVDNSLRIYKNNELKISQIIKNKFDFKEIYFKTGHGAVGELDYFQIENKGFFFMDTCEKSWKNYYQYYTDSKYLNDIILKCDDDIVFIDLLKLPNFIEFINNNDNYDLIFANIINNGVSAYYQQNKYNLIPKSLIDLEYPNKGINGSLWSSGTKAEILHNYFIDNYKNFINYNFNNDVIPIDTRFSINFFGYLGKNWYKIKDCFTDDETNLTVDYVNNFEFKNFLYTDFIVSHLSFFKQVESGINLNDLLNKYNKLYNDIYPES